MRLGKFKVTQAVSVLESCLSTFAVGNGRKHIHSLGSLSQLGDSVFVPLLE